MSLSNSIFSISAMISALVNPVISVNRSFSSISYSGVSSIEGFSSERIFKSFSSIDWVSSELLLTFFISILGYSVECSSMVLLALSSLGMGKLLLLLSLIGSFSDSLSSCSFSDIPFFTISLTGMVSVKLISNIWSLFILLLFTISQLLPSFKLPGAADLLFTDSS